MGAGQTVLPVKEGGVGRTVFALLGEDVVALVAGAAEALPRLQVEIFGVVAFDAAAPRPEQVLNALALAGLAVEHLVDWAALARLICRIVVLVGGAAHALLAIEDRGGRGTVLASLSAQIVHLVKRAAEALFPGLVEVLGEVALDTVGARPVGFVCALAYTLAVHSLASRAVLAALVARIEVLIGWAGRTLLSVENGPVGRALLALPHGEVVDLVGGAALATLAVQVKVLWVVALDAVKASEELLVLTFALLRDIVIDPPKSTGRAGPQFGIPVLGRRAERTLLAIEVGEIRRTIHTHSGVDVVDHGRRAA